MRLSRNFISEEFACKCGCGSDEMDSSFIDRLQLARDIIGRSLDINSGLRCIAHNKAIGSKDTSSHPKGNAVDVEAENSRERFELVNAFLEAGFRRIGVNAKENFVHIDTDETKDQDVIWIYN